MSIEEKASKKLMKFRKLSYPIMENVGKGNDWVEQAKSCMKAYVQCYSSIKSILEELLTEGVKDQIANTIRLRCWDISTAFCETSLLYVRMIERHSRPMSVQSRKITDDELASFWGSLRKEFEDSQKELKTLYGRATMSSAFSNEDMRPFKEFIERMVNASFEDLKRNLENDDDALAKIDLEEGKE
jgi:hypothetical protein